MVPEEGKRTRTNSKIEKKRQSCFLLHCHLTSSDFPNCRCKKKNFILPADSLRHRETTPAQTHLKRTARLASKMSWGTTEVFPDPEEAAASKGQRNGRWTIHRHPQQGSPMIFKKLKNKMTASSSTTAKNEQALEQENALCGGFRAHRAHRGPRQSWCTSWRRWPAGSVRAVRMLRWSAVPWTRGARIACRHTAQSRRPFVTLLPLVAAVGYEKTNRKKSALGPPPHVQDTPILSHNCEIVTIDNCDNCDNCDTM